ncbi:methionyl-tRNA formyltransferase [Clostridium aestuarii]|uniref:Methionyl-tRNA formyltransferase n=1 Tax=Clostridium aestuarii TaxID=338193 RepID=A0ABT4D064_9CLOT|nr:methionyl-tRNA formyltransferase [Clostridium aestuarii]MCY6483565.1 methionyl-tRNA formyltransferase [Clostridium aestuarii]
MKILFYGDGPWAQLSLIKILDAEDIEVKGVILRYSSQDPVLREIGESADIPVYVEKNVNSEKFVKFAKELNLDLSISMSFDQIIKKELRETSKNGFINCHAGKLPNFRGRNILNWALINDEKEIGITAHYIDDGIDTGDIISQAVIPIEEKDTYNTLLKKTHKKCPEVLLDAVYKIKENRADVIKQSHIKGSYFSYRRNGDELIDWNWTSRKIHNFIRALAEPSPGAQTYLNDEKIYIWESEEQDYSKYISTPGEIIGRVEDGIIVKTGDTAIKIKKISNNIDEEKYIPSIPVGRRLGIDLYKKIFELQNRIVELEEKLTDAENKK